MTGPYVRGCIKTRSVQRRSHVERGNQTNLVIHGPLIATLLLDLYWQQGRPLKRFSYRAQSPLFLPHAFTVSGKAAGHVTKLWASNHAGGLAMEADAAEV